jgi:hypothetical protein
MTFRAAWVGATNPRMDDHLTNLVWVAQLMRSTRVHRGSKSVPLVAVALLLAGASPSARG